MKVEELFGKYEHFDNGYVLKENFIAALKEYRDSIIKEMEGKK